jgi:hypothetical protein
MYKFYLFFFLTLFNTSIVLSQKNNENNSLLTIQLKVEDEKVERARYYQKARSEIKIELIKLVFENATTSFGKKYSAVYNPETDDWSVDLPKGLYNFRTQHIGFDNYNESVEISRQNSILERPLTVQQLPKSYENGDTFNYIKGGVEFSETVIVHFKAGTADENMAFLSAFPNENVQKLRFCNSFLLTLNIKNQESLAEVLLRQTYGDDAINEGYYIGDEVNKYLGEILKNPNVKGVEATYVYPEKDIAVLTKNDFPKLNNLLRELKNHSSEEPKRLKTDEIEKTQNLKDKLLKTMEGN